MMREKIVRGGTAVFLRQIVSLPINALGIALASRLLLPADFGVQAILIPVIAFAVMVVDLGTSQALVQSKSPAGPPLLGRVQRLKFINGAIITGVLALLSAWVTQVFSLSSSFVFLLPACGLLGWLQSQRAYQAVTLQRQIEWQTLAREEMVEIIVYNSALVALAYLLRSAWCFVLALGLRMAIGAIILKIVSRKEVLSSTESGQSVPSLPSLLRFGIPLQASTFFSITMNLVNPIIIGSSLGMSAAGLVNWSNYVVSLPQLPLQPLPGFLFSVLSERRRQDRNDREIITNLAYVSMVLMALCCILIMVSIDMLVQYVFGAQWISAIPIANVLILGNILFLPSLIITAQLNASGHASTSLFITGLGAISTWVMVGVGSMIGLGVMGYAVGVVVASLFTFGAQCLLAYRLTGIDVRWSSSLRLLLMVIFSYWIAQSALSLWGEGMPLLARYVVEAVLGVLLLAILILVFERSHLRRGKAVLMRNLSLQSS